MVQIFLFRRIVFLYSHSSASIPNVDIRDNKYHLSYFHILFRHIFKTFSRIRITIYDKLFANEIHVLRSA